MRRYTGPSQYVGCVLRVSKHQFCPLPLVAAVLQHPGSRGSPQGSHTPWVQVTGVCVTRHDMFGPQRRYSPVQRLPVPLKTYQIPPPYRPPGGWPCAPDGHQYLCSLMRAPVPLPLCTAHPTSHLQGREVTVTFAEPRRSDRLMEVSRSLHVSGLPTEGAGDDWVTTTETALRDMLSPFGKVRE